MREYSILYAIECTQRAVHVDFPKFCAKIHKHINNGIVPVASRSSCGATAVASEIQAGIMLWRGARAENVIYVRLLSAYGAHEIAVLFFPLASPTFQRARQLECVNTPFMFYSVILESE